jgi:CHAT domain-containing protein/tetratricopeptide (TPR) repeat protein
MLQQASGNADGYNLIGENPYINSMPTRRRSVPARGLCGLAVALLALLLSAAAQAAAPPPEETVPLGESRERPIAAGETQAWRVVVPPGQALLVTVELHGIDLGMEARRSEGGERIVVHGGHDRWGPEVLLLDTPGEYRIEVRPMEKSAWPGRYTIRTEVLPAAPVANARRDALALMSQAGREAAPDTPEAPQQAVATYREALAAWRSLDERTWEAETRVFLAVLEKGLSDLPAATQDFLAALALWQKLKRPDREAESQNWLGVIYKDTQKMETARDAWESALSLWHGLGEQFEEAVTRGNLCYYEQRRGSLQVARACHQENLAFFHEHGIQRQEAKILSNMGGIYDSLGEPDNALAYFEKARALQHALGDDPPGEVESLINIAAIHRTLGEWQEALRRYQEIRDILVSLGNRTLEATVLNHIGFVYNSVGEPQRALSYFTDALKLRRETGNRAAVITSLNNLGSVWRSLGDLDKALDQHRQALTLAQSMGDGPQQAVSRRHLAEVDLDRGDVAAALREIDAALPVLLQKGGRRAQAEILDLDGQALVLAGRPLEALPVLRDALARHRDLRDRAGEAETLYTLALAERSLGHATDALSDAQEAVTQVEELRIGFLSADLRASFLATRRHAFSLLIDLLMDRNAAEPGKGYESAAFAISERARARVLLDVLRAGNAGSTAPPGLLERRTSLLHRLSAKVDRRSMQSGPQAEALEKEIDSILIDVDAVEAEIRRQDRRFAAFSAPPSVDPHKISASLEPGTMLLEYSLGENRSVLWAVEAGRIQAFLLPGQKEIENLARRVYEEVSTVESGKARRETASQDLSQILLGPVWSEAARLSRLVVVPDGALGVLPFAALPVPDPGRSWKSPGTLKPLLERLEVVYIPSATTLAVQRQLLERRVPASKWAAVFADPVFAADDSRLAHRSAAILPMSGKKNATESRLRDSGTEELAETPERLRSTLREADAIASLAPPGQVWRGLGLDANRESVLSGSLRNYRFLHFATHAVADTRHPELSGMMLSRVDAEGHPRQGFLGLSDIYDLDLDADLVVLSGCRTALGKEVRGEGLMGLTRGFQYAGVPRVVASLWRVQDRATAELMTRFYRAMWRDHMTPAAALREAQRSLRSDSRYRAPYFWAGFVLQGDWH